MTTPNDVLVIGAGLAGAAAVQRLVEAGQRVIVLDKGRGPGGRLSTRRVDGGTFDHGAAWLQPSGEAFRHWLESRAAQGVAAPWRNGWVGVPGMNALVASSLEGAVVRWQAAVERLHYANGRWEARDAGGATLAEASRVVVAIPTPQAAALLRTVGHPSVDPLIEALDVARYAPCWAGLFVVDDEGPEPPSHGAGFGDIEASGIIGGIYREADKPGRAGVGHWVVHATATWSRAHLELDAAEAARQLLPVFLASIGRDVVQIRSATAHRWRYANPMAGAGSGATDVAVGDTLGVFLAGDAIGFVEGGGVSPAEVAWRSGRDAASRLLAASGLPRTQPKS